MKRSLGLLLCLLILAGGSLFANAAGSMVGKAPPEVSATKWLNSTKPVTLKDLKGKVVVVEFWATWCPPCRKSIPHLIELSKTYKNKGVVFVSLSDEDAATVTPFAKENKMDYIVGAGSDTSSKYGVTSIPHAVVVGKDGKVVWEGHPMDGLDKALAAAVK